MQEEVINRSGVKDMPEEIKDHHLQMLGMKTGNQGGRMDKKKVSVTQVQVKKNLEKAMENAAEEENGEESKEQN